MTERMRLVELEHLGIIERHEMAAIDDLAVVDGDRRLMETAIHVLTAGAAGRSVWCVTADSTGCTTSTT